MPEGERSRADIHWVAVNVKLQSAAVAKESPTFQAIFCAMSGGDDMWVCSEWKRTVAFAFVISRT